MNCEVCAHAAEHGYWGDTIPEGYTHDRDSHATFPGSGVWGSCSACGNIFRGNQAFDFHQEAKVCSELRGCGCDALSSPASLSGAPPSVLVWTYSGQTYVRRHQEKDGFWFYQENPELREKKGDQP